MKKDYRIKNSKEFALVFNNGKSFANRQFVLYVLHNKEQEHFRLGLSVSKKIGNAVTRNRVKRLIREVFHQLHDELNSKNDYVVIARKPVAEMDFEQTKKSLMHVMKQARVMHRKPNAKSTL